MVGKIKFGEWIDSAIRILIINLDGFSLANYDNSQIRQTFLLPNIPAIPCILQSSEISYRLMLCKW